MGCVFCPLSILLLLDVWSQYIFSQLYGLFLIAIMFWVIAERKTFCKWNLGKFCLVFHHKLIGYQKIVQSDLPQTSQLLILYRYYL